jgi:hypothetical protein
VVSQSSGPRPLTNQRSPWERDPDHDLTMGDIVAVAFRRRVHDGTLSAFVAQEPPGWHLSISHRPNSFRSAGRYPAWDEIAHARYELLPDDITVAMLLPPPDEYVALHDTTFHLHEIDDPDLGR